MFCVSSQSQNTVPDGSETQNHTSWCGLLSLVEPEGFEPSSKQAITELSTCLVLVSFSMHDRPKTAYHTLSFFSLGKLPKQVTNRC